MVYFIISPPPPPISPNLFLFLSLSGGEELGLEGTDPGTVADQDYDDEEDVLEKPRILLMGPRRYIYILHHVCVYVYVYVW